MIFVTVGTHEQQFNRLIQKVDELKRDGLIQDEVFMQIGYSTYEPKYCDWKKLLPYDEMDEKYKEADIIITHGGPASFMKALELGKTPIVVPRQVKYDEHVNDHQVEFVKFVEERLRFIIVISQIDDIKKIIVNYKKIVCNENHYILQNNQYFNGRLIERLNTLEKNEKGGNNE